jgi:succinate dehydrogenase / fumarate reductase cytochrome b subunit
MAKPPSPGFFRSSIGKKVVMAASGAVLLGFVLGHLAGNLQVYLGPAAINAYALKLRHFPALLWAARVGLLVAVTLHIWSAYSLSRTSWDARPVGYRERETRESTYASRTMRWGGVIVLLFVVYHLMHFTFGIAHPSFAQADVFHNMVAGFRNVGVSGFYSAAMVALGLHLYHGVWSMMQTLGLSHRRYDHLRHAFATLVAVVVVVGNISFPLAVLTGLLHE